MPVDQAEKLKLVESYGEGDPGELGFIPMMAMIAVQVKKVDKSPGGIVIPDSAPKDFQTPECTVLAVGPEVKYVRVGDRVLVSEMVMASKVFVERASFVLVKEEQLYGIDKGLRVSDYVKGNRT